MSIDKSADFFSEKWIYFSFYGPGGHFFHN